MSQRIFTPFRKWDVVGQISGLLMAFCFGRFTGLLSANGNHYMAWMAVSFALSLVMQQCGFRRDKYDRYERP
jgi:hypothetical protein